ncbi:MAG: hypothetical protein ACHQ53_10990, partial [Polyangiales bacterium]
SYMTTLTITGRRPLIIATEDDLEIDGTIVTAPSTDPQNLGWQAGGPPGPSQVMSVGMCALDMPGIGGGNPGQTGIGSGGGSFCGIGGAGSALYVAPVDGGTDAGTGPSGGAAYGTDDLVPLAGGSSGGSTNATDATNHGGGAIELVAGTKVTIGMSGVLNVGGGGSSLAYGIGGGSGGGILLEAPNVVVQGVLAANGGSGSNNYMGGQSGLASAQSAVNQLNNGPLGGNGSAGANVDGKDGTTLGNYPIGGGGGGGAGRIRVNTGCGGKLSQNGGAIISPSTTTTCFSTGTLK